MVQQHRQSPLTLALLSIVLVGGEAIHGDQSNEITLRAFRRAKQVTQIRLKKITEILTALESMVPLSPAYPFVYEYYTRERRVYGRTLNMMGRLLFDLGEWKNSIVALESAVALDPTIPEAYEWLARAYDRDARPVEFFSAWHQALSVDPWASDRNVWPVFCVTIQHPSVLDTPRLSINKERQKVLALSRSERTRKEESGGGGAGGDGGGSSGSTDQSHREMEQMKVYQNVRDDSNTPNHYDILMNVINSIRHLECTATFVGDRNQAMHEYHEQMMLENKDQRDYTFINFAYGMVFYHGFHRLFTTHTIGMEAIRRSRGRDLEWVSFGSNVGTETFYSALTWNLKSVVRFFVLL